MQTTLPATLANSRISLRFVANAQHGVTLDTMTDLLDYNGNGPFVWTNAKTSDDGSVTGRLWEILLVGPPEGGSPWSAGFSAGFGGPGGNQTIQAPPDVEVFSSMDQDGREALIFLWSDVLLPASDRPFSAGFSAGFGNGSGTNNNLCDVYAMVSLGATDSFARWSLYVHRHGDLSVTVDNISFPIVAFEGPVAARPATTHLLSQKRSRVLIPDTQGPILFGANTSLFIWSVSALEFDHPCGTAFARHVMSYGCGSLWAGDSQDQVSYGRMMHFGVEDVYGYTKTIGHRGVTAGTMLLSAWFQRFVPEWATPPFRVQDSTQFGCDFRSPYSVIIGVDIAKSADWTFDAADWYRRTIVKPHGLGGIRKRYDRSRSKLLQPEGQWLGCIRLGSPSAPGSPNQYERFQIMGEEILEMLGTDHEDGFWQFQNILLPVARFGGTTGVINPDKPVTSSVDPLVLPVIQAIHDAGGNVGPYTEGLSMLRDGGWVSTATDGAAEVCDRFGRPIGEPNEFRIDYGSPAGQVLQAHSLHRDLIAAFGFHGFYCDGISGGNGRIAHTPAGLGPQHIPHGGKHHSQGKRKTLRNIRNELTDSQRFLISEAHEEYVHQELDLTQDKPLLSSLTQLGEDAVLSAMLSGFTLDVDDVSPQSRDMNPPVFQTVYSQYTSNGTIAISLTTRARADHPGNSGVGLTVRQWNECLIWNIATIAVQGLKVLWFCQDDFFDDRVNSASHPTEPIVEYLPKLWDLQITQARRFLLGEMGRQFDVDYSSPDVDTQPNPLSLLYTVANSGVYPVFLSASSTSCVSFQIETVLHRVWIDPEDGSFILLLMNWSGIPSSWRGKFVPWHHGDFGSGGTGFSQGFSDGFRKTRTYSVSDIAQDGNTIPLIDAMTGTLTVHANGSPSVNGADIYLGKVPAYGIRVLHFAVTT